MMTKLVPVLMIFKVVRAKVTQKDKWTDRGTVKPHNNGPRSSEKSLKSGFSFSPLTFISFAFQVVNIRFWQ